MAREIENYNYNFRTYRLLPVHTILLTYFIL